MATNQESTKADPQRRRLWLLFLAGPVIYALYFLVVYTLGEFGCLAGIEKLTFLGMNPIRAGVIAFTIVAALATTSTGLVAYRRWRYLHEGPKDPDVDDPKFMLFVGVWLNGLFTVVIVATAIPMLLGSACQWI